jgi:CheY-like chemotaxis protein
LAGKRILIVDDNATQRGILSRQTQSWGMLARDTASGSEALAWVRSGARFDIALLDLHMPGMDGLALAAEVRKHRDRRALPLVILAPLGQLGANSQNGRAELAYLSKPVKPSQLHQTLARMLGGQPSPVQAPGAGPASRRAGHQPLRILLAEDNPINQKVALSLLEKLGYHAQLAGNGQEVLAALERQAYDVILMDVHMPEMDGIQATRRIRARWPREQGPAIIAMTASAMNEDRESCLAAGMDDFVGKPVRTQELLGALAKCQPYSRPTATPAIDTAVLQDLGSRIGAALAELIGIYLEDAPKHLASMRQAVAAGDSQAMFRAAHTLKPSSASLGALPLATLCEELERMGRGEDLQGAAEKVQQIEAEFERVETALETAGVHRSRMMPDTP